jgi:hypothetical protein
LIEDETSQICPKASAKVVNRCDETRKKANMRESIKSPEQGGIDWPCDNVRKAKDDAKQVERSRTLIGQYQKKCTKSKQKGNRKGNLVPDKV